MPARYFINYVSDFLPFGRLCQLDTSFISECLPAGKLYYMCIWHVSNCVPASRLCLIDTSSISDFVPASRLCQLKHFVIISFSWQIMPAKHIFRNILKPAGKWASLHFKMLWKIIAIAILGIYQFMIKHIFPALRLRLVHLIKPVSLTYQLSLLFIECWIFSYLRYSAYVVMNLILV